MLEALLTAPAANGPVQAPALLAGDWVTGGPVVERRRAVRPPHRQSPPSAAGPDAVRAAVAYAATAARDIARLAPAARADILDRAAALARRSPGRVRPAARAGARQAGQGRPRRDWTGSPTRSPSAPPRPGRSAARCCRSPAGRRGVGNTALTYRAPAGVALAITPFNAPANLLAHKLGASFAAGNTTIVKAPPQAPAVSAAVVGAAARRRRARRGGPAAARRRRGRRGPVRGARGRRHQLHRQRGDRGGGRPRRRRQAARPRARRQRGHDRLRGRRHRPSPPRSAPAPATATPGRAASRCSGSTSTGPGTTSSWTPSTAEVGELRRRRPARPAAPTSGPWWTTTRPSGSCPGRPRRPPAAPRSRPGGTRDGATVDPDHRRRPAGRRRRGDGTRCSARWSSVLPYDDFDAVLDRLQRQPVRPAGRPVHPRHRPDHHRLAGARGRRAGRQRLVQLPARPRAVRRRQGLRLRPGVAALDDRGLHRRQDAAAARRLDLGREDVMTDRTTRPTGAVTADWSAPAASAYGVEYVFGTCGHTNIAAARRAGRSRHRVRHRPARAGRRARRRRLRPRHAASPACCCVHVGPGMMNAVTGVATAALDSVPLVAIAGDVPSYMYGRHPHQEVNLHADADQTAIYRPFVKRAWHAHRVEDLAAVHRARVLDRHLRPARARCCSTCRWTCSPGRCPAAAPTAYPLPADTPARRRCPPTVADRIADAAAGRRAAADLPRRRARRRTGLSALLDARRASRHPDRALADGQGHRARRPPAAARHARLLGPGATNAYTPRRRRRARHRHPLRRDRRQLLGSATTPGGSRRPG